MAPPLRGNRCRQTKKAAYLVQPATCLLGPAGHTGCTHPDWSRPVTTYLTYLVRLATCIPGDKKGWLPTDDACHNVRIPSSMRGGAAASPLGGLHKATPKPDHSVQPVQSTISAFESTSGSLGKHATGLVDARVSKSSNRMPEIQDLCSNRGGRAWERKAAGPRILLELNRLYVPDGDAPWSSDLNHRRKHTPLTTD